MGSDPAAPAPQESTAEMLQAYTQAFPDLLKVTNAGQVGSAQAQLAANQATAPGLAALQAQIYQAFGPQMAQTANQIAAEQAQSQAASDLAVQRGTGQDLVKSAVETQKLADPEYYKAREITGNRLGDLLGSIDLNGKLSGGENEAISRGLAQSNQARGTAQAPSQTDVVSNAMTYGGAQRDRENQSKDQLTQALQVANGALPALKSGVDTFQVSTGRSSGVNAGDSKFTGVDTSLGNGAQSLGNNLLQQTSALTQQKNDINANRRDQLDRFNQTFSSVVGSL